MNWCIVSMLPFIDAWIKDWQLHTRIHVHCLYAAAALFIQAECRVQWGSGPNFKAFRFAWSSTVKVSRVRGPIVFGWSLLLQPKLSHKKINNIYQTHNIYLSPPLKKILRGYLLSCHIRIFWSKNFWFHKKIPSTIIIPEESPVNSTINPQSKIIQIWAHIWVSLDYCKYSDRPDYTWLQLRKKSWKIKSA